MNTKIALSVAETAREIGISRPSVYALLQRADHPLPSVVVGRRRIIPREMLMEWIRDEAERNGLN